MRPQGRPLSCSGSPVYPGDYRRAALLMLLLQDQRAWRLAGLALLFRVTSHDHQSQCVLVLAFIDTWAVVLHLLRAEKQQSHRPAKTHRIQNNRKID